MVKTKCKVVGDTLVCGSARHGAGIKKKGVYRLHKGEIVVKKPKGKKGCKCGCKHHKQAKYNYMELWYGRRRTAMYGIQLQLLSR